MAKFLSIEGIEGDPSAHEFFAVRSVAFPHDTKCIKAEDFDPAKYEIARKHVVKDTPKFQPSQAAVVARVEAAKTPPEEGK